MDSSNNTNSISNNRINIKCPISGQDTHLQLDKKDMPGEPGPCFMISAGGCFKGYIARRKNGSYQFLGTPYYASDELERITDQLTQAEQLTNSEQVNKKP